MKNIIRVLIILGMLLIYGNTSLAEDMDSLLAGVLEMSEDEDAEDDVSGSQTDTSPNLFDDIIGQFQTEQEEAAKLADKLEKQQAFDASAFAALGTCKLYQKDYTVENTKFDIYLFPQIDEENMDNIITSNRDARYYSTSTTEHGDFILHTLRQFGDDGKQVYIVNNISGHAMVMVEVGLLVEGYLFPQSCTTCSGSGDCKKCNGTLTCPRCHGHGYLDCLICNGSGHCSRCNGSGRRNNQDCYKCKNGECTRCSRKGYIVDYSFRCTDCNGSLKCKSCEGNGKCYDCQGTGR